MFFERRIISRESYNDVSDILQTRKSFVKIRGRLLVNQRGVIVAQSAIGKIFVDVTKKIFLYRQNFFGANAINFERRVYIFCEHKTFQKVCVHVEQSFHRQIF